MEGLNGNMDFDLLAKYLAGEATQEEQRLVEGWKAMSVENAKEFRRLELLWDESMVESDTTNQAYDIENAWAMVKGKIKTQESKTENPKSISRHLISPYYLIRIAAVLLVGIAVYFIYNTTSPDAIEVVASLERMEHALPDGSAITIMEGASITYEDGFGKKERQVKLRGEAYFEVEKDANRPFTVVLDATKVVVLGTSFLVENKLTDSTIEVSVVAGKVAFIALHLPDTLLLTAGQKGVYNKAAQKFEPLGTVRENALFWKTNTLVFRNERIIDVIGTLKEAYGKPIQLGDDSLLECRFTGRFSNESLEGILQQLALSFDWKVTFGETITIEGKGC